MIEKSNNIVRTLKIVRCMVFPFFLALTCILATSCSAISSASARLTYKFQTDSVDKRISYEPGSEDMVTELSPLLQWVEKNQFKKYKNESKIVVYIFNDKARYSRYSTLHPSAYGGSTANEIYISAPRLRERPESIESLLIHELSHVHMRQYTGSLRYVKDIPQWFHEGLAVSVSGGAGALLVTKQEASKSILSGSHFLPDDTGSLLDPKTAWDFGLHPDMFYRQSQMFIEYLLRENPNGFMSALEGIRAGEKFRVVWETNYSKNIGHLWLEFIETL